MALPDKKLSASRAALWFGLLGGAGAWTVHLLSAYACAEFGCVGGWGTLEYASISRVAWLEIAATSVTTFVSAAATAIAWRSHRRLQAKSTHRDGASVAELKVALAGVLTSGLFTFIILFESIPIVYYLRDC